PHPHRHQVPLVPDVDLLAVRLPVVGEEERGLIDAVDVAVGRHLVLDARKVQRGVEQVHQVEQVVALPAGLDHAAPIGDARNTAPTFPSRALASGQLSSCGPLSEVTKMKVLSRTPASSSALTISPI